MLRSLFVCFFSLTTLLHAAEKPNIIFILADDLAQGDLGCYGQQRIKTPRLDQMAAQGTRFLQGYSGTSVCAPSRTSLMTGLHIGHAPSRGNKKPPGSADGQWPLPAETLTVAEVLKGQGYATACMGKWGMGDLPTTGNPTKQGFDHFFGYNCQSRAHQYFPPFLHRDNQRIELDGKTYAQNLIQNDVLKWVRDNSQQPFFLFYPVTLPHGKYEIDKLGEYEQFTDWTAEQRTFAAMVTRLDSDVGQLLDLLRELKIDKNTLVMFSGDNGAAFDPRSANGKFFNQDMGGKLRGHKRSMYEGGLRQPSIAWWPGVVPAGKVWAEPWAFWDFLPTAAELAGATLPKDFQTDGLSLVEFLRGGPAPKRDFFYWELHERQPIQAVRFGDWKAVKNGINAEIELYDLATDEGETSDLAASKPEVVKQAEAYLRAGHVDDPNWPMVARPAKAAK